MSYIFTAFIILLFFILTDILASLVRLKTSGIVLGFRVLFFGAKYENHGYSINDDSRKRTVLIIGDSTAVGPGANREETIAGRLSQMYRVNIVNLAVNGARTSDVIHQIKIAKAMNKKLHLTIVHTGNNDIWRLTNLQKLEKDIISLLDKTNQISERVVLFRGGNMGSLPIFPLFLRLIYTARSRKIGQLFKRIAEEKSVLYVEKFMYRRNDIFLKDPYHFYCWDLLHLNENGYRVWFDHLIDEMSTHDRFNPKTVLANS